MPSFATKPKAKKAGAYLQAPAVTSSVERFSSGCALLDCVLGGGWCVGRMENIIGDRSTAKTGLAIEAMANFAEAFPKGWIKYREAESAFDTIYAEQKMGLPRDRVNFWADDHDTPFDTVEDFFEDLEDALDKTKAGQHGLYIVDSLDALSDRAEAGRKIDEGSYAMTKAKKLGELFRRLVRKIEEKQVCLIIVSQVRANIGAMFGEKYTRTGGKSMDFYATHCLWLAHMKIIKKTRNKEERATAVEIKASCKKNKAGKPFRECTFEYVFDYGVADLESSVEWLSKIGKLKEALGYEQPAAFLKRADALEQEEYRQTRRDVGVLVAEYWNQVDDTFAPTRRKYG